MLNKAMRGLLLVPLALSGPAARAEQEPYPAPPADDVELCVGYFNCQNKSKGPFKIKFELWADEVDYARNRREILGKLLKSSRIPLDQGALPLQEKDGWFTGLVRVDLFDVSDAGHASKNHLILSLLPKAGQNSYVLSSGVYRAHFWMKKAAAAPAPACPLTFTPLTPAGESPFTVFISRDPQPALSNYASKVKLPAGSIQMQTVAGPNVSPDGGGSNPPKASWSLKPDGNSLFFYH